MVPASRASYTEDGFTWSVSPLWTVIAMTAVSCAGIAVYAVLRFIMGDPDEEPVPMSEPDPTWEARRREAADAMRGRIWEEPS
jgi:hypothetical protein